MRLIITESMLNDLKGKLVSGKSKKNMSEQEGRPREVSEIYLTKYTFGERSFLV